MRNSGSLHRTVAFTIVLLGAACHRGPGARARTTTVGELLDGGVCAVAPTNASLAASTVVDPLVTFDSAWLIIARSHWDTTYNGVNWRALRDTLRPRAAAAKTTGELRTVLSEMIGRLKQSHFSIIPRELSDETNGSTRIGTREDRSGAVGITLRYVNREILVTHVRAGSSAARAGVLPGWSVGAVNGCALSTRLARIPKDMESRRVALTAFSLATQALAGPVGDTVRIAFLDGAGAAHLLPIARETEPGVVTRFGNLPPLNAYLEFERIHRDDRIIGVIRFNIWMPVLVSQFNAAIDALRDTDGIVLDLRGNFGGVGGMSMGIAGHFLDSAQTIGTMHQRGATLHFVANPQRVDSHAQLVTPYAGPLALVVDELSISTTEIFVGGLKELGRARVFGVQTAGQALPSVPERLPNGDVLYHAIADFVSPSGKQVEGAGVIPDVVTPLTRKALASGRDPAMEAAVQWLAATAKHPARAMPRHGRTP